MNEEAQIARCEFCPSLAPANPEYCIQCGLHRLDSRHAAVAPVPAEQDAMFDEVERRMEAVVDAAVEWHQSDEDWQEKADALEVAVDSLLELRSKPSKVEGGGKVPGLLACPFCGGKAKGNRRNQYYETVECENCTAETYHKDWNARAHSDKVSSLERQVAGLVEALEGLSTRMNPKDGTHCWCTSWDWTKHTPKCVAARTAIAQAREEGVK